MRIWLFRAIALILPLLVLLLAELALRATGAGDNWPLFKVNPANPAYLVTETDIVKRYFANNTALPSVKMEPAFLLAEKPDNAIRLVVQGGLRILDKVDALKGGSLHTRPKLRGWDWCVMLGRALVM